MDQSIDWMHALQTKEIVGYIQELDLLHNWLFIAAALLFVVVSLLMNWRLLLTCTISLSGLIAITAYVTARGTDLEGSSDGIFMFVGGGAAIMFFFIYMLFMRGD
jgi:phosphotransferase system  glucose/maltose/N-acetylglucosamine-specific IIC component